MRTFANPILPGFHPDPSVCRWRDRWVLVTSTFEWWPALPVATSTDLVHWTTVGHGLERPAQLDLGGRRPSAGLFAPTIRCDGERLWIACTDMGGIGHFLIWADDPAGPWSDPIPVALPGIDPSLYPLGDGTAWFTYADGRPWQARVHLASGAVTVPPEPFWAGTGNKCPEGPHLYRIGEHWYAVLAEGGTEYGHLVSVARGPTPSGPWEAMPGNPLLSHRVHYHHPFQGLGHGDWVEGPDGAWWMVCLGFRPVGGRFHHLGRETFLVPLAWEDGWPRCPSPLPDPLPAPAWTPPAEPPAERWTFDRPLDRGWLWLRRPDPRIAVDAAAGVLRLAGGPPLAAAQPVLVGRRLDRLHGGWTVRIDARPAGDGGAGLVWYMNPEHWIALAVVAGGRARLIQRIGAIEAVVGETAIPAGPVDLALVADGPEAEARVAGAALGRVRLRYLASEVARGFTGTIAALAAWGEGTTADVDRWAREAGGGA